MDRDYHTFLYLERAEAEGKYAGANKCRQTGWSYKLACKVMKNLWFRKKQKIKVFSKGSKYIKDFWNMCSSYRNHLLTNTGWTRQFWRNATKDLEWHMIWKAQDGGKDVEIGRDNWIKAINTSTSSTNLVGGYNTLVISEESGVDADLLSNIGFVDASLKQGDIVTGNFVMGGSVGELKDCEGLRAITYQPRNYGFLAVPDLENPSLERLLFIPLQWNYIHPITDPEDESIVIDQIKCYDEDGNSDIDKAMKLILDIRAKKQKQDPASYTLYCSQNPTTLDELYQSRENSIFDQRLVARQSSYLLENYEDITVELKDNDNGTIYHELVHKPIVTDLPLKTNSYREGAIIMWEPPIKNPKPYMYFAGVDPVKPILGTGVSLFSIYIYLNYYEENGELKGGYYVACYTGRYFNDDDTFEVGRKLIKYYNAMTACESDVDSFINYMKSFGDEKYILKRSQIPILRDLVPNSSINSDEYGVRMNTGGNSSRVKKHMLIKLKEYTEEKLDYQRGDENIPDKVVHGIERIKCRMLLKELAEFSEKEGNFDRVISSGLALMVAKCYENNGVMQKIYTQAVKENDNRIQEAMRQYQNNRLNNQFKRTKFNLSGTKLRLR
jgi:hypothetical protein